jgi:uncharacterized protein
METRWIKRYYEDKMDALLKKGKVLVIYGPRRVGKTSLIEKFLSKYKGKKYLGIGDDIVLRNLLSSEDLNLIKTSFSNYKLIAIDEAQRIPNIGIGLKIIIDNIPNIKVMTSGSSSFSLSNKIGEPLTGRQKEIMLYPVSILELYEQYGGIEILEKLKNFLIYGTYPEILTLKNFKEKTEYLHSIRNSYLFKDILELENIKNSDKIINLLRLLAFQIGRDVSLNELSNSLGIARQTVEKYLDLLEKNFIIKRLKSFSKNLRKEISKSSRYYFFDNGIRNSIINNFNDISLRDDIGMLWENFLFIQRIIRQEYFGETSNNYFWRTYDKKEIDLIEERDGKLFAYEFKWGNKKKSKAYKFWLETYKNSEFNIINKNNFLEFLI